MKADNGIALSLPPPTSIAKPKCLIPTAELYDLSYAEANVRITKQVVAITSNLTANALTYAEKVADAVEAARNKASPPTTARLLGTPGKIWAIADRMDQWVWCKDPRMHHWSFACINHGFHEKLTGKDKFGRPTVEAYQNKGGCHNWSHVDYSQIFTAVAGWCLAKKPDETRAKWRTASLQPHGAT
jgi:hypothetical protein